MMRNYLREGMEKGFNIFHKQTSNRSARDLFGISISSSAVVEREDKKPRRPRARLMTIRKHKAKGINFHLTRRARAKGAENFDFSNSITRRRPPENLSRKRAICDESLPARYLLGIVD
jgi:hypothetical protein